MKLKNLFLGIACFVFSSNYEHLFADDNHQNMAFMSASALNDEIRARAENICAHLEKRHSTDEIIAKFNDSQEQSHKMKEFITLVNEKKQCSKKDVINIMVNNKEAEEFYVRENFWVYFEMVVNLLIIVAVFYLLYQGYQYYQYYKMLYEHLQRSWFFWKR